MMFFLTSKICDYFGYIGIPFEVSRKVRDKYEFRHFCAENGLPVPKYKKIENQEDIQQIIDSFKFPVVIKPSFGSSSAFVVKSETPEELVASYQYILNSISKTVESALSDGMQIMVEEYIDGDEVDIDILIQNGRIKFYGISDNTKTKEPFFIETDRFTPSNLPQKDQQNLIEMADEVLEKLGIQDGCIHFEAKATKKGPVPIEVNVRMGGDEIYSSVKMAFGVDLIENALKIAIGQHIDKMDFTAYPKKHLIARTLNTDYSGIISKFEMEEDLKKKKYLEEIEIYKKVGDSVFVPPEGYEYLGWIMVSGDNFLDAMENLLDSEKLFKYDISRFQKDSSIGTIARKKPFPFMAMKRNILAERKKIEKIQKLALASQRKLHVGIAINTYEEEMDSFDQKTMDESRRIGDILKQQGYTVTYFDFNRMPLVYEELRKSEVDIVLNLCEQMNNSILYKPQVAALLESLQIPFTGSSSFTIALSLDKIAFKKILAYHNVPTPKWDYAYGPDDEISEDLEYPLIVKPSVGDNSIGISNDSVVKNKEELITQIKKVTEELKVPALIEEYIEGDEYDISLIGNDEDVNVLPICRTIFKSPPNTHWHIYPFEAKWSDDTRYKEHVEVQIPPKKISKNLIALMKEIALDTFSILDCRDYARVELRVDKNNNPFVIEINPNPFLGEDSIFVLSAKASSINLKHLIEEILFISIKRNKEEFSELKLKSDNKGEIVGQ
jgi:D-alanine-D-alanine ligase